MQSESNKYHAEEDIWNSASTLEEGPGSTGRPTLRRSLLRALPTSYLAVSTQEEELGEYETVKKYHDLDDHGQDGQSQESKMIMHPYRSDILCFHCLSFSF